eukprot:SAG25_NODE_13261_length_269_cov_0.611765_1_plen_53_part_01
MLQRLEVRYHARNIHWRHRLVILAEFITEFCQISASLCSEFAGRALRWYCLDA